MASCSARRKTCGTYVAAALARSDSSADGERAGKRCVFKGEGEVSGQRGFVSARILRSTVDSAGNMERAADSSEAVASPW